MSTRTKKTSNKFRRDAWIEVNLSKLEQNINTLADEFQTPLIPVVKADAYGHGADIIVKVLDSFNFVYGFAVANLDEAYQLAHITSKPIIILGVSPSWLMLESLNHHNIEYSITDLKFAQELNKAAQQKNIRSKVHIKLDFGMNRVGFKPQTLTEFNNIFDKISKYNHLKIESIFSHYSHANNQVICNQQYQKFKSLVLDNPNVRDQQNIKTHMGSSIGMRNIIAPKTSLTRIGIDLYGLNKYNQKLKPLLSLFGRVVHSKIVKAGETISYESTQVLKEDSQIITLPLGYADGVRRSLSNKINISINNKYFRQIGNITMDQMMAIAPVSTKINIGQTAELINNNGLSLHTWAEMAETITYELLVGFNLRLPKVYTR